MDTQLSFRERLRRLAAAIRVSLRERGALRAWPLLAVFVITFVVVVFLNPLKAGLAMWGISKLALGAYVGYWADRLGFTPEDRPHAVEGIARGTAWKRRALIMAAAILAAAFIP